VSVPMPLEWHPWYRDKTWLLDWLEGKSGYPEDAIVIPVPPRLYWQREENRIGPETISDRQIVLTKHRAWGSAPYVDTPFHYEWTTATDHLNRSIASDARIVYDDRWPLDQQRS